ncbi:hypothetical protein SD427_03055 [Chryseobacterium sp. JJR-5R]|uniref:hypothetical protein n=1 Tax=Chryseobacterium sp. JJR-5R TaxID=3093923 RepID=UPI002A74AE69|nr:hypothetical protein [Chryseobacterium sp. JJR-5R]WPO83336.1 hypothetical protein SD427_03055 [Chryseobacterium sp. JJR-5R]
MLVQNPSKIFTSDLAVWQKEPACILTEIIGGQDSSLRKTAEIIFDKNGCYDFCYQAGSVILIVVLYGEITINDFEKPISAEQVFTLRSGESSALMMKNNLPDEKSDVLVFELKSKTEGDFFAVEELNVSAKNTLIQISENIGYPNFMGLYDGRKEERYALYKKGGSIFGMVINGAFEFQNRLMENRDAIIISEMDMLEFEALSENALMVLLEV